MALAPSGETQIVVQIDEKNLALLALGQKALASADAFPDKRFAAEVVYINPGVDPLRGSVEVKLGVPQPPAFLRQDMTVSVDIEVAHRSDAVTVPADAVRDATGAQPWVLALNGHRAVRRPVQARPARRQQDRDPGRAWRRATSLIPATDALVKPGQRVRAAQNEPLRAVRVDRRDALHARGAGADAAHHRRRGAGRGRHRVHVGADRGAAVQHHPPHAQLHGADRGGAAGAGGAPAARRAGPALADGWCSRARSSCDRSTSGRRRLAQIRAPAGRGGRDAGRVRARDSRCAATPAIRSA